MTKKTKEERKMARAVFQNEWFANEYAEDRKREGYAVRKVKKTSKGWVVLYTHKKEKKKPISEEDRLFNLRVKEKIAQRAKEREQATEVSIKSDKREEIKWC